jgi:hypothetical protein
MVSPQAAAAHAWAWNQSLTSVDFWNDWAVAEFSSAVASQAANIFISVDSFALPRPVNWIGGPGGLQADNGQCNFKATYSWVDTYLALRPTLVRAISNGAADLNNLERFDYWGSQFTYSKCLSL